MHEINAFLKSLAILSFSGVALYLAFSAWRSKQQTAMRKALLDKFGSARDLSEFLQSEGGQRFMAELSGVSSPLGTVMASIHKGILTLLLGGGIVFASAAMNSHELMAVGGIFGAVGIGFMVSAAVTYTMSKRWGLFVQPSPRDREKIRES
jgi:hypothetical protein